MKCINFFKLLGLVFLQIACTHIERVDTTAVKEAMSNYKIKKISSSDVLNEAKIKGEELSSKIESANCIPVLIDSLNSDNLKISELDLDKTYPELADKVQQIFEAYQYAFKGKEELPANYQQVNDSIYNFTFHPDPKNCPEMEGAVYSIDFKKAYLIQSIKPE